MKIKKWGTWLTRPQKTKRSIHEEIAETIAERNRILPEWEKLFVDGGESGKKDIHVQLKETISAFKKNMEQHKSFFMADQNKKAA